MATPLQYGDPPRLGPFVLQARLLTAPAGLVYLGQGPDGRVVSVAVLTRGAALDAAARDRFVTAITDAERHAGRRGAPAVLAMDGGPAPWVAVPYAPGGVGAERFLEPVMVSGMLLGDRNGPDFVPFWLGDRDPALPAPAPPGPPPVATRRSVGLAAALLATLVTLMVVMMLLLLFRPEGDQQPSRPLPPPVVVPTPPPTPASPRPGDQSPTPSEGGTERRTAVPGGDDDLGGEI
ncbi:hypothetical protein [Microtetraspora niveoalba]|uniref:hypothetical protein n=1 Tax=Microtetraspora niveoalba TaxID=46175 RepID=UPI001FE18124|nr:hypothetical protein [Microtetraspora niveoalba]